MEDVSVIPAEILVVEDNPSDVRLFLNEFKKINFLTNVNVVTNDVDALKYLNQDEEYNDFPRPDLLVLDLYMPNKNGIEVLSEMSKYKHLRDILVVIFSASEPTNILINYQNDVQHIFITKPNNLEEYKTIIKIVENFWLKLKKK